MTPSDSTTCPSTFPYKLASSFLLPNPEPNNLFYSLLNHNRIRHPPNFESRPLTMSDQSKPMTQKLYDSAPSSRQTVKFLTAITIGAALLFLSGLTLTGTVIALIVATPVLVLFSPILVPAGIVTFLAAAGLLFSGGCGVAAMTALSWIYNYLTGKQPPGAEQLDQARTKIASKARDMKERAKEYGQHVQIKAQEATTKA